MDFTTIVAIAGPTSLLTAGIAWGTVKTTLNGTKDRVKSLESSHKALKDDTTDRLARIETKVDSLLSRD